MAEARIELTLFSEADLDWLLEIEAKARIEGFIRGDDEDGHRRHLANPDMRYLTILSDGEKAGFVILAGLSGIDESIEFGRIIIAEDKRGAGQGAIRTIIQYIFDTLDAHRIWLDTLDHNVRGQHIYEKLGFRKEGRLRQAFLLDGRRHDMLLYGLLRNGWEDSSSS